MGSNRRAWNVYALDYACSKLCMPAMDSICWTHLGSMLPSASGTFAGTLYAPDPQRRLIPTPRIVSALNGNKRDKEEELQERKRWLEGDVVNGQLQLTPLRRALDLCQAPEGWQKLLKPPLAACTDHAVKATLTALTTPAVTVGGAPRARRSSTALRMALLQGSQGTPASQAPT